MKGRRQFTSKEAHGIRQLLADKLRATRNEQKVIRGKIRGSYGFYITDFSASGAFGPLDFDDLVRTGQISVVGLENGTSTLQTFVPIPMAAPAAQTFASMSRSPRARSDSDEAYVIDLCDEVLGRNGLRQHRFPFLKGDGGHTLPVDAYYPDLELVIEYRERQHSEAVKFFDRRETVSGVGRGEQRRLYDERRREVLPQHGLQLVEIEFRELAHTGTKRLLRDRQADKLVLAQRLAAFTK